MNEKKENQLTCVREKKDDVSAKTLDGYNKKEKKCSGDRCLDLESTRNTRSKKSRCTCVCDAFAFVDALMCVCFIFDS